VKSVATVGRWSLRHPWSAIAGWLAFVAASVVLGGVVGTGTLQNGAIGESARGYALMDAHQAYTPAREYGYLHSDTLLAAAPAFRSATTDVSERMRSLLGGRVDTRTSADRHSMLVTAIVADFSRVDAARRAVLELARAHPQVTIEETGDISAGVARDHAVHADLHRAELLSVPVTLVVLLFAFGSVVAALVPVVLALTAVAATFGLLGPVSQVFPLDDSVKTVVLLIGMAVGVDYALFYVVRSREERHRGASPYDAVELTTGTSGRTVLVSGSTVAIAMAGMYVVDLAVFNGIASGTILVVGCAVVASVTVLPAVLGLLGARIDHGRIPYLPHLRTETTDSRFWPAVIDRVLKRPLLSCLLSAGFLLALAVPALWLHVAKPSNDALAAQGEPALATLAVVRREFPSAAESAVLVVASPRTRRSEAARAVRRLEALAVGLGIAHPPFTVSEGSDGEAAAVELPLAGSGDNSSSRRAVGVLRRDLVPRTLGRIPGVETAVTGAVAEDVDFTDQMKHGVPYVIAFVLALAFPLLLVAFRSVVVPVKAILLNLLSVAAAYGVLVLVFEHRWAQPLLGFRSNGEIISWLPLFLFVVLFGLSMDYHVFILSRVREAVDGGMPTEDAVRYGITVTAGVVTSAALVMVGVFSLFGTLSSLEIKEAGVGLAAAVLIDATIVRAVLLPSTMKLLGEWNWYLPHALSWIPSGGFEASPDARRGPD
jgi:RND superfamily putative drug exporter